MASKQQTGQSSSEVKVDTHPPSFFRQKTELTEEEKQRRENLATKARPVQRTSSEPVVSHSRYTCKHCGHSNPITNKFCNKCGKEKKRLVRTASRGGRRTKRRRHKRRKKRTKHHRRRSSRHRRSRRRRRHTRRRRHRTGGTLGGNLNNKICFNQSGCPNIETKGFIGGSDIPGTTRQTGGSCGKKHRRRKRGGLTSKKPFHIR